MTYLILDQGGQDEIRATRLLKLEREHYLLLLQLGEMNAAAMPADQQGRREVLADLAAVEAAINWHRQEIEPPQRVEPGPEPANGDDGPTAAPPGEKVDHD